MIRLILSFNWALFLLVVLSANANAQFHASKQFDVHSVFQQLESNSVSPSDSPVQLAHPWWDQHVGESQRRQHQPLATDIHSLIYLAVKYSNQIRIARENPVILKTAIAEADSRFDWVKYLNSSWNDTSEPVTNTLVAGGNQSRLNDHIFQVAGGARRQTRYGGQLDLSQRFGWQDNNSQFFVPGDQASSQLTISYTHPLLRGRGYAYNNSLVVLAQIDAGVAQQEFLGVLQQHLLEVVRAYWLLYQERSTLAQQVRLYLSTEKIVSVLQTRQSIDAQRTQLITASSALENRRSDLIRARTAVINAETRLRGLINAPELSRSDIVELIPTQQPALDYLPSDLQTEIQTAVQNRPEVQIAIQQVKAGATRLGIAQHELLPALNLVTQGFVNGLNGNNDFGGSFVDQFSEGAPSYSVGINYELPIGNRLARTRLCRRQVEARQLQARYELALANIQTEVDIAFRELQTAYREIQARSRALGAAESEAETIEMRWSRFIDGNANAGLNLESLLRAQERVTQAERDYVTSLLTYNLAVVDLKRANGTLLNCENVQVNKACDENGCGILQIEKFDFNPELATVGQSQIIDAGMTNEASIYETALPPEVPSLEPLSGTEVNLGDLEQ